MKIYKYPFRVADVVNITMPQGATLLTVQVQYGGPCIWALVDRDQPLEERIFRVSGTGHELDIDMSFSRYIGTFQIGDDERVYVWHLFEVNVKEVNPVIREAKRLASSHLTGK